MLQLSIQQYRIGKYTVDLRGRRILREGIPLDTGWRCFDALRLLIEAQGSVVDRHVFFRTLWPDVQVEETSLTKVMTQLRRVLANSDPDANYIETIPRLGYRLTVPAEPVPESSAGKDISAGQTQAGENQRVPRRNWLAIGIASACVLAVLITVGVNQWKRHLAVAEAESYAEEAARIRNQGDPASVQRAVGMLRRATELNPRSASHFAALADTLTRGTRADGIPKTAIRDAAERAVSLDPNSGSAHAVLGFTLFAYFWEWEKAGGHIREALRLSPQSPGLKGYAAMYFSTQGRLEEALREIDRSLELSPYFGTGYQIRSTVLTFMERYEDAVSSADRALSINSRNPGAWDARAAALARMGKEKEALASWIEVAWSDRATELEELYRRAGMKAALARLFELTSDTRREQSYRRARWKAYLGDADGALDELEIAHEVRHFNLIYVGVDPFFKPLRENPRFLRLIEKMRLDGSRISQVLAKD